MGLRKGFGGFCSHLEGSGSVRNVNFAQLCEEFRKTVPLEVEFEWIWKVPKRWRSVWQVLEGLAVFKMVTRGLRECHATRLLEIPSAPMYLGAADEFLSFPFLFNVYNLCVGAILKKKNRVLPFCCWWLKARAYWWVVCPTIHYCIFYVAGGAGFQLNGMVWLYLTAFPKCTKDPLQISNAWSSLTWETKASTHSLWACSLDLALLLME